MFTALKKLVTNEQGDQRPNIPSGMQTMGVNLQRRFAKGVQYNMKVIIKGDRNTGKTTLFHRLQGGKFKDEYTATSEIQVASIQWNYKATDDVVKVEVWDVVDKGKPRKRVTALKIANKEEKAEEPPEDDNPCLDASFLDVYKGTNGVVMLLDVTKKWTWKYVQQELPRVPNHIPVLVMASFRDQFENQAVYREEIEYFIRNLDRPPGCAHIRVAEASMKNGFGLKYLHSFFNIPFLQLQRETLLQQLQRNQLETDAMLEELDARVESEDQDYDMYLTSLTSKGKSKASLNVPNGQAPRRASDSSSNPSSSASATPARVSPAPSPSQVTPSSTPPTKPKQQLQQQQQQLQQTQRMQQSSPSATPPLSGGSVGDGVDDETLGNRFSKWFAPSESKVKQGTRVEDEKHAVIEAPAEIHQQQQQQQQQKKSRQKQRQRQIEQQRQEEEERQEQEQQQKDPTSFSALDDFVPDEGLDGGFFDETDSKASAAPAPKRSIFSFGRKAKPKPPPPQPVVETAPPPQEDSDSDDEANPMVAGFQEELDSDDEAMAAIATSTTTAAAAEVISPSTDEPESPFDTFSRKPPRLNSDDWSFDEDARPTVIADDNSDSDSELDAPPATKTLSSTSKPAVDQNMGWSLDIASGAAGKESSKIANTATLSSSSSSKQRSEQRLASSSSSTSSPMEVFSPPQVTAYRGIDSSADEEEEIAVLQDVEDVSDDDGGVLQKSERTDSKDAVTSKQACGTREHDKLEEDSEDDEKSTPEASSQVSPTSVGLTLQLEDLNFLESVTSKPKPTVSRNTSRAGDEFDILVSMAPDEDISETETNTSTSTGSSAKKKKKKKSKDREDDEENSKKKRKSKKHRDRDEDREERRERRSSKKDAIPDGGEEKKKKKKKSSSDGTSSSTSSSKKRSSGETKEKKQEVTGGAGGPGMDDNAALEAFLEGF